VQGRVTLDGKPLSEAAVLFIPLDGDRKKTGAAIDRGQYRLPTADGLLPGQYRVEIIDNPPLHSERGRAAEARRNFPYRYAHESPLRIEISPNSRRGGPLRLDFDLTSSSE
jgi:hypothetical protein